MKKTLLVHAAATLFMVGAIWFIQIVHYPLFNQVGADNFILYEAAQMRLTILILVPVMLVEAATAVLLLFARPESVGLKATILGVVLLAVIWISTVYLQMPLHSILTSGFDTRAYRELVSTNWVRTITWSLRGLLVLFMISRTMK